ncbi:MAG: hypothetical protein JOZ18_00255 [Chloroflexi bacterium]|nr:hypothetical protein [Chloroflexota bacterium]
MLVAYGPDGRAIAAEEMPLEQLQSWSHERMLYCPNCRGIVHVRGGPEKRTQLHFAHQRGECAWSTEAESLRHARGKLVLSQWLREQFPQATITLEKRLPEPNRIADVFVAHADGQRWAVEFQCAPLDVEEWRMRHDAYRKAGIIDIWIIGNNRREKQEAFIEAILAMAHEIMFLDPQVTPTRVWLRWPITRNVAQEWQNHSTARAYHAPTPALGGWVGRMGYGATLIGSLHEIRFDEQTRLIHPIRAAMEMQARLLQAMSAASTVDEEMLRAYLHPNVSEETLRVVLIPLMRAYSRDPELLRRYNYGRGQLDQAPGEADKLRVRKAREWMLSIAQRGFTATRLQELVKEIPFVGPYAAFVGYIEMLIALSTTP